MGVRSKASTWRLPCRSFLALLWLIYYRDYEYLLPKTSTTIDYHITIILVGSYCNESLCRNSREPTTMMVLVVEGTLEPSGRMEGLLSWSVHEARL